MPYSVDGLTVRQARLDALAEWNKRLAVSGGMENTDAVSGSSPPSVFVGSSGYPHVAIGPMVPPRFGDTEILDSPELWAGRPLADIVAYRLGMVRGIKTIPADAIPGRYVEGLQDMAMGSKSVDMDLVFDGGLSAANMIDGNSAPFGPVGSIRQSHISNVTPNQAIQRCYYDTDMTATDAMMTLYQRGTEISRIQRCLSVGMFGQARRLVPTKWSITATDDTISVQMVRDILEYPIDDACRLFGYAHMGNVYRVIIWPRRWAFGFAEAWQTKKGPVVGADSEMARGLRRYPETEGAYHAARLAVAEYMVKRQRQGGALVFREISPHYSIPVGVWQVREGIRSALRQRPTFPGSLHEAINMALTGLDVPQKMWLGRPAISDLLHQHSITEYW